MMRKASEHLTYTAQSACRLVAGVICLGAFGLMLTACGAQIEMKSAASNAPKADEKPKVEAAKEAPKAEAEKDYVYTSIGKRDPFYTPFDDLNAEAQANKEENVTLSPLQNYDVGTFSVSGIIWGISSPTAMVIAPDGQTYIIKTGSLIGRNWGKVVKIKRDAVVILEQSPLPDGTKVSNMVEIKLPMNNLRAQDLETSAQDSDTTKTKKTGTKADTEKNGTAAGQDQTDPEELN